MSTKSGEVHIADSAIKMRNYMGDVQRRGDDAVPGLILAADVYTFLFMFAWSGTAVGFPLLIPLNFFIVDKSQTLNLTTFYQMLQIPALADLKPSSPAIDSLNRFTTDALIQRSQVIGQIPARYASIRVLQSALNDDAGFSNATKQYRAGLKAYKVCKYFDYATILGWGLGRKCGWAYRSLRRLDDRWTAYVNGTDAFGQPAFFKPFDGVVPNDRSIWPGGGLQFQTTVAGVNHLNIYKTQLGLNQIVRAMLSVGGSPVTPPPNAITGVSVTGPTRLNGCQAGTWTATVSGGTAPINYTWTVENTTINTDTSRTLSYYNMGSAPSIFVKVTAKDVNYTQATSSFKTNLTLPGYC